MPEPDDLCRKCKTKLVIRRNKKGNAFAVCPNQECSTKAGSKATPPIGQLPKKDTSDDGKKSNRRPFAIFGGL